MNGATMRVSRTEIPCRVKGRRPLAGFRAAALTSPLSRSDPRKRSQGAKRHLTVGFLKAAEKCSDSIQTATKSPARARLRRAFLCGFPIDHGGFKPRWRGRKRRLRAAGSSPPKPLAWDRSRARPVGDEARRSIGNRKECRLRHDYANFPGPQTPSSLRAYSSFLSEKCIKSASGSASLARRRITPPRPPALPARSCARSPRRSGSSSWRHSPRP